MQRSNVVGVLIETGKATTRACCDELVAPATGVFHTLHARHGLCPWDLADRDGAPPLRLDTLCQRRREDGPGNRWPWEMLWVRCRATGLGAGRYGTRSDAVAIK